MPKLTIQTVYGAIRRDTTAMHAVLAVYDGYITAFSKDTCADENGVYQERFDPDKKSHLQIKLLSALPKFNIERSLPNE